MIQISPVETQGYASYFYTILTGKSYKLTLSCEQRYKQRIDLTEVQNLHWWKFKALFDSLNEETQMKKIMYYRKVSTSGMDRDRRAYINEMKKLYSLSKDKKKMTLEQRNASWIAYVKSRKQK